MHTHTHQDTVHFCELKGELLIFISEPDIMTQEYLEETGYITTLI